MADFKNRVLPYRTTGEEVLSFLNRRVKGHSLEQIQALYSSAHAYQGTLIALTELGFLGSSGDVTELGQALSLAKDEERARVMLRAVAEYEPYGLLLEALLKGVKPDDATSTDRIERWWSVNQYGKSANNRTEASTAFARFVEFTGLGEYRQGRRGHSSRIEWAPQATSLLDELGSRSDSTPENPTPDTDTQPQDESLPKGGEQEVVKVDAGPSGQGTPGLNTLRLNLSEGRIAVLTLPPRLTQKEKERLLRLVDLLIEEDEPMPDPSATASPSATGSLFG